MIRIAIFALLAFALTSFVFSGCGITAEQINATDELAQALRVQSTPLFERHCKAQIRECKADGMTPPDDFNNLDAWADLCPGFETCWTAQKHTTDLVNSIHIGAAQGALALSFDRDEDAAAILRQVLERLKRLKQTLDDAGILDRLPAADTIKKFMDWL